MRQRERRKDADEAASWRGPAPARSRSRRLFPNGCRIRFRSETLLQAQLARQGGQGACKLVGKRSYRFRTSQVQVLARAVTRLKSERRGCAIERGDRRGRFTARFVPMNRE